MPAPCGPRLWLCRDVPRQLHELRCATADVRGVGGRAAAAAAQAPVTNLGNDANGNPRRLAVKTGHISNYDETKVPPYTLPDPLVLANGKPVKNADTWRRERRPEIMRLYETEIFGRVPASAPKVTWQRTGTETGRARGTVTIKRIAGTIGQAPRMRRGSRSRSTRRRKRRDACRSSCW